MKSGSNRKTQNAGADTAPGRPQGGVPLGLADTVAQSLLYIQTELGDSPDLLIRRIQIGGERRLEAAAVHLSGLADPASVNEFVLGSLLNHTEELFLDSTAGNADRPQEQASLPQQILSRAMEIGDAELKEDWKDVMLAILSGDTAILLEGCRAAILCGTRGGEQRAVSEPSSQLVVRGPKDGFVESVATNISLIRRRIKSAKLRLEVMKIGSETHTHVALMYMKGIAGEDLIRETRDRLNKIVINEILESGYIEELIQDKTFTPFPTIYNTERPDVAAGNLLEGRVVIIVDGTPFVLILPAVFTQFFQSAEDYSQRFDITILMRLIRYLSFLVLILGPSVYLALTTYHYEMIPTTLLINLLSQRENVPFPAFVELLLMEMAFEILREAGVRMPRAIGQTVSVVGALILGTAVVEAGIITPIMVIVVALTGIASFALPAYNLAIAGRIIRFAFLIMASIFGFYGITLGLILLVAHMSSLRSFGVPYLFPFVPLSIKSQKDTLFRLPLWLMGPDKPPAQMREEMPDYMLLTTGHEEELPPLIRMNARAEEENREK
ncbi:spore germination protein [Paenibacillus sp. FSL R7-0337]|uniref:spore germination protein n=1 Tax=unclassified Paenibacillus TaxID=185978 RepID=UPI00096CE5F0|nr:spore germination protein [Paenibacillus sp. FSL R7-0337]OMF99422.1 spore germination protein [Paenibacillus sp. FSL R7-0337]